VKDGLDRTSKKNASVYMCTQSIFFVSVPGNLYFSNSQNSSKFFSCSRLPTAALDLGRIPASASSPSCTPPTAATLHLGFHI
jgi:hypothetical protein